MIMPTTTTTILDAELEAQITLWASTHGSVIQRREYLERQHHGRQVLTFLRRLDVHLQRGVARLRRTHHQDGTWEVLEDPDKRPPAPAYDDLTSYFRTARPDHSQERQHQRRRRQGRHT
jgi:hypothetical protein